MSKVTVTHAGGDKPVKVSQRLTVEDERSADYPRDTYLSVGGVAEIESVAGSEIVVTDVDEIPAHAVSSGGQAA